jgi:putative ABC transport system ATP-binding protein
MRALDGVDLDVRRGELVLLMGPSGSGKTTLLSIMGCILRASGGTVRILGRDVSVLREHDLPRIRLDHIGFVFQGFNLFPTLTAAANVAVALDLKGVARREAAIRSAALLEQVGLGSKRGAYPADLSGGQKQRVAIARAIAGDPPIVLADEPTAALDTHSGHVVMNLLRSLAHARDRSVVIVSHDNRMLGYADRIVHMEDGRIRDADLTDHKSRDADLTDHKSRDADLTDHKSRDADLTDQKSRDADLTDQKSRDADLTDHKSRDADLTDHKSRDADLTDHKSRDADLTDQKSRDADLAGWP